MGVIIQRIPVLPRPATLLTRPTRLTPTTSPTTPFEYQSMKNKESSGSSLQHWPTSGSQPTTTTLPLSVSTWTIILTKGYVFIPKSYDNENVVELSPSSTVPCQIRPSSSSLLCCPSLCWAWSWGTLLPGQVEAWHCRICKSHLRSKPRSSTPLRPPW